MNMRFTIPFVGLSLVMSIVGSAAIGAATDKPAVSQSGEQSEVQIPVYTPPKN